jgi:DNA topoisomerase-3
MEMNGKKLTQKQVETLVKKGKTGKLSCFVNESGESFDGIILLDENKLPTILKKSVKN